MSAELGLRDSRYAATAVVTGPQDQRRGRLAATASLTSIAIV
jgi:hypothetical protein